MKLRPTDILFAKIVKKRDNHTCQRCFKQHPEKSQGLHCAHFHGRAKEGTRHEPDNCVTLCWGCHRYFHSQPDEFTDWFKKRIGENRFKSLMVQANTYCKRDDKIVMIYLKELAKYDLKNL